MNISKTAALPAVGIAAAAVITLQVFLYDGEIILAQASSGRTLTQLIAQLVITIAVHLFVILMVPMLLIARRKFLTGYAVLVLSLAAYIQITTDLSLIGAAVALIAFSVLVFCGVVKLIEWLRYLRAD